VKLADRTANIYVTDDGISVLSELAGFITRKRGLLVQRVREADERGLWIEYKLEDGEHLFLLQWIHIRGIELSPEGKEKGLD
jgi:hypothetical protein